MGAFMHGPSLCWQVCECPDCVRACTFVALCWQLVFPQAPQSLTGGSFGRAWRGWPGRGPPVWLPQPPGSFSVAKQQGSLGSSPRLAAPFPRPSQRIRNATSTAAFTATGLPFWSPGLHLHCRTASTALSSSPIPKGRITLTRISFMNYRRQPSE